MNLRAIRISLYAVIFVAVAFGVVFVFLFNAQTAHAQCPAGDVIKVNHARCTGPGIPCGTVRNGRVGTDGCMCKVSGQLGGDIKSQCLGTCCMRVSETSGQEAAKAGGGDPSKLMEILQKLLGGGGGGGGGGGEPPPPSDFGFGQTPPGILDGSDGSFLDTTLSNITDAIFGGGSDGDSPITNDGDPTDTTDPSGEQGQNDPAQEGDTVVTTYEYLEAVAEGGLSDTQSATFADANGDDFDDDFDRDLAGEGSDFDDDFFGADLDDGSATSTLGLSQQALEIAGLEELARRGANVETHSGSLALPYESLTPAEIRSLQDYHSSAVAVSGRLSPFQGNPLSNDRFAVEEIGGESTQTERDGLGFFSRVFSLLANIFGFGSPATN